MKRTLGILLVGLPLALQAAPHVLNPGDERLATNAATDYLETVASGNLLEQQDRLDAGMLKLRSDVYGSARERALLRNIFTGSLYEIRKVSALSDDTVGVYARITRPDGGVMDWVGFFRRDAVNAQYRLTGEEDKLIFCTDNPLEICE